MGCCVSTAGKSAVPNSHASKFNGEHNKPISKSPPRTLEEETVKEVLSETPAAPKQTSLVFSGFPEIQPYKSPFIKSGPLLSDFSQIPDVKKQQNNNNGVSKKSYMVFNSDEVSEEYSEICSTLSESVSVSTTVTENRDNNDGFENGNEVRRRSTARFKNRSLSGEVKRDKTVGKSPGRRSDPSPGRARSGPMNEKSGPPGHGRRDNGESSCRRSMSPVTRTNGGAVKTGSTRNQMVHRNGTRKSPGLVGSGLEEKTRMTEEGKEMVDNNSRENNWPPTSSAESLENPLVSMECFIFL